MSNCLVAFSGETTAISNAVVAGLIDANQSQPYYGKVYGALNGIRGLLQERFVDLTLMGEEEKLILQQTPSAVLGCSLERLQRDKLSDFEKIFTVFQRYDIEALFLIGGNDALDSVVALNQYALENNIRSRRFIACPATIYNDLLCIDHCPGFASAAKYIASTALDSWLDFNACDRKGVFILQTMGHDAGWLGAAACISGIVDLLLLPEVAFDQDVFLAEVRRCLEEKSSCYVVMNQGCRYSDGREIASAEELGRMIRESGTAEYSLVLNPGNVQRSFAFTQALTDVKEAFELGSYGHKCSLQKDFSGRMLSLKRAEGDGYQCEYSAAEAEQAANFVRTLPVEWLLPNYRGLSEECEAYFKPLIVGSPSIICEDGLPVYVRPYYL